MTIAEATAVPHCCHHIWPLRGIGWVPGTGTQGFASDVTLGYVDTLAGIWWPLFCHCLSLVLVYSVLGMSAKGSCYVHLRLIPTFFMSSTWHDSRVQVGANCNCAQLRLAWACSYFGYIPTCCPSYSRQVQGSTFLSVALGSIPGGSTFHSCSFAISEVFRRT